MTETTAPQGAKGPLDSYFQLSAHGTNVRTEVIAGITTFLTMAYIIFVNPQILATTGMDQNAVFVATCVAAALGSAIMGFYANWPIAMAPGMGLNAFFAFTVVGTLGYTWQQGLGAVFISGCIFLILTVTGVRRWLVAGIPHSMRSAVAAGIGMFLGIIALKNAGIVVASEATYVSLGHMMTAGPLLAMLGFFLIAALDALKVTGAILIGILAVTVLSILLGVSQFGGIIAPPPSIAPTFLQLDVFGVIGTGIFHVILVFVLVEIFDATGTLIGVAKRAGLLTEGPGHTNPQLGKALLSDSTAIVAGSFLGTSSTTAYVESASGVLAGGRTAVNDHSAARGKMGQGQGRHLLSEEAHPIGLALDEGADPAGGEDPFDLGGAKVGQGADLAGRETGRAQRRDSARMRIQRRRDQRDARAESDLSRLA